MGSSYSHHNAQHRFCHQQSTLINRLLTDGIINEALNDKASVDIETIDFARAFDKVPHDLLLQTLQRRMIPVQLLNWMRSYLEDKKQCVRLAGVLSSHQSVTSGIIQGSCLAPTCLTLFIGELFQALSVENVTFADDVKFVADLRRFVADLRRFVADLRQFSPNVVQNDLNIVYNWSIEMRMPISVIKCIRCHFGNNNPHYTYMICNSAAPEVKSYTDLGVIRSSSNDSLEHISLVVKRARRLSGLI